MTEIVFFTVLKIKREQAYSSDIAVKALWQSLAGFIAEYRHNLPVLLLMVFQQVVSL